MFFGHCYQNGRRPTECCSVLEDIVVTYEYIMLPYTAVSTVKRHWAENSLSLSLSVFTADIRVASYLA